MDKEPKRPSNEVQKIMEQSGSIEVIIVTAATNAFSELIQNHPEIPELKDSLFSGLSAALQAETDRCMRMLTSQRRLDRFPIIAHAIAENVLGSFLHELQACGKSDMSNDEIVGLYMEFDQTVRANLPG